jgi:hypothetical protein
MEKMVHREDPQLEKLGHLDTLVLQSGNNDDDGNRWLPKPNSGKVPPEPLTHGIRVYLSLGRKQH